jgi:hypothetical protein
MTTGDTGTGTYSNYFKNWLSDEKPNIKDIEGWGLDALRSNPKWKCNYCEQELKMRDQYLYRYTKEGTIILHNKKDCYEGFISRPR